MSRSARTIVGGVAVVVLAAMIFSASARTTSRSSHPPKATAPAPASAATAPAASEASTPVAPPGTVLHVVAKGELLPHVIRKYWAASSYMTHAEMEAALRAAQ